jgi:hypothetical protein
MRRWLNLVLQATLGTCQLYLTMQPELNESQKLLLCGIVSFAQLAISGIAHSYNPDGTSARVAYLEDT